MIDWTRAQGWEINDGPKHVYLKGRPTTAFRLKKEMSGTLTRYRVEFDEGLMPPAWTNAIFDVYGEVPMEFTEEILDPWKRPDEQINYNSTIAMCLQDATTNHLRLEGEIEIDGKKNLIILLPIENAVKHRTQPNKLEPLMIVLKRAFLIPRHGNLGLLQDGAAHARQN